MGIPQHMSCAKGHIVRKYLSMDLNPCIAYATLGCLLWKFPLFSFLFFYPFFFPFYFLFVLFLFFTLPPFFFLASVSICLRDTLSCQRS